MQMTFLNWILLCALSILWGGSFFFTKVSLTEIPPLTLVFLRVSIAAFALWSFITIRGIKIPWSRALIVAFLIMGLLNNILPFSLQFWAQQTITSSLASILNATMPIFSIVIAHFTLADEKMAFNKLMGVILGFIGVAILLGGDALDGVDIATVGIVACLAGALSYGFASVYGRRFHALNISLVVTSFGQLCAASVIILPVSFALEQPWTLDIPSTNIILSVLALALVSTALAYLLYFKLLAEAGAVNSSLVTLLIPAVAALLGIAFLGEILHLRQIIGFMFIAAGLLAIDGRPLKLLGIKQIKQS